MLSPAETLDYFVGQGFAPVSSGNPKDLFVSKQPVVYVWTEMMRTSDKNIAKYLEKYGSSVPCFSMVFAPLFLVATDERLGFIDYY